MARPRGAGELPGRVVPEYTRTPEQNAQSIWVGPSRVLVPREPSARRVDARRAFRDVGSVETRSFTFARRATGARLAERVRGGGYSTFRRYRADELEEALDCFLERVDGEVESTTTTCSCMYDGRVACCAATLAGRTQVAPPSPAHCDQHLWAPRLTSAATTSRMISSGEDCGPTKRPRVLVGSLGRIVVSPGTSSSCRPRSMRRPTMIDSRSPVGRCLGVDGVQGDLANVEAADHTRLASLLLGGEDEPVVAGVAGVAASEGIEVLEGALLHQGHLSA